MAGQSGLQSARRMSHGEQLARVARRTPDVEALRFEGRSRTFAELDARVDQLASALRARGIGTGDRVATLMMNRMEVVETYLATSRLGAICVPVNFRLVADEIVYILSDCGATVLVVDEGLAPVAGAARQQVPAVAALPGHRRRPVAGRRRRRGVRAGARRRSRGLRAAGRP